MPDLRLADLLAALSQVTDLGMGYLPGTAIRTSLLATRMARITGLDEGDLSTVYYTTLLQHVGCTAYAHETAALFGGDDIRLRSHGSLVDSTNTREVLSFVLFGIAREASAPVRARAILTALKLGSSFDTALSLSNCEVALQVAGRLGLGPGVQQGLAHIYERWDGKGNPSRVSGEDIALPARFADVASQAIGFQRLGGPDVAIETVRQRSGAALDPDVAAIFVENAHNLFVELDEIDPGTQFLDAEPEPCQYIPATRLDGIARAFGDMVDLKSPYMHGHSSGVARIASEAARRFGLAEDEVISVRRAGFLHDLGHAGVPNGIWDKRGPLTAAEWEQVRLHPYYAERVLMRSTVLAPLAPLVGMHHDRQDGSGYHHHASGQAIPPGAKIIAAADVYHAMTEKRPHRPAHSPETAANQLRVDAVEGRLDAEAVNAVLEVIGHDPLPERQVWPAGLTGREVTVLRVASSGLSNKEIGDILSISPKTAGHHIQHIYNKIGVSTRAGAAMFAMKHDLVREPWEERPK